MDEKSVSVLPYDIAEKVAKDLVEGITVGPKTVRQFAATYLDMLVEFKRNIRKETCLSPKESK